MTLDSYFAFASLNGAEETFKVLCEERREREVEWAQSTGSVPIDPRRVHISLEDIDLIANLVVERLKNGN